MGLMSYWECWKPNLLRVAIFLTWQNVKGQVIVMVFEESKRPRKMNPKVIKNDVFIHVSYLWINTLHAYINCVSNNGIRALYL